MKKCPTWKLFHFSRSTTLMLCKNLFDKRIELILKTMKGIWIQRKLVFFNEISLQTWADLKSFLPCNDYTIFCKNTLHKSYNFTSYSNLTAERTLHKIIITHITFNIYKRILFQTIHTWSIANKCSFYCADT